MSIQIRGIFAGACVVLALVTRGVSAMPVEYTQALDILGKRLESPQEMKASETQAISLLEAARLKAIDPDQKDDVNLLLGYLYRSNEDADKAISCYREVMAHNPERQLDLPEQKISGLSPITGLGYSYEAKGELEKAVACWEVRLRSDPSAHRISAHLTLAYNALEKAGKLPIIEVEPKDLAGRLAAIEQANVRAADLTSFEKSCQKVIKSLPNHEDTGKVYARIVEVLVAKGSKEAQSKSLAYCEKAVQYPLDVGTASRLYENWGCALDRSPVGPDERSAADYAKTRPAARCLLKFFK
jgi:tetratricopeptide (TPR) repeat protein